MSIMVRVFGQMLFVSMVVQVFGQRLLHGHASTSIWSETLTCAC